jgi:transposase
VSDEPTTAELLERLAQRDELIGQLQAELVAARAEIAELRRQLGQDSRNSSKPPSSDGLAKPAPRSQRRRSGRKPGGQGGHPGSRLEQVAVPDEVIRHEPGPCRGCGGDLGRADEVGALARQVFDLPPITVRVVEHQLIERRCGCGSTTRAAGPETVTAPVQYGPRITAVMVYLYVGQFLSKARTAQALAELFDTPVSAGTVAAVTDRAAGGLAEFCETVRGRIAAAEVAHFDETGLRVAGKLRWVHSASTDTDSLITCHDKRGREAMNAAGVLPNFSGIAVHDAWAPYDSYHHVGHALCNAHVLRELQAVTDLAEQSASGGWCWATQAGDALRELGALTSTPGPDQAALAAASSRFRAATAIGAAATRARSTKPMAKEHALARRLIDRRADYLRFTVDPRVPFDNNAAEREIRMIKLRQKVSGCQRTLSGAVGFCAIRSYLATAAKHGIAFLHALESLAQGRVWLPEPA